MCLMIKTCYYDHLSTILSICSSKVCKKFFFFNYECFSNIDAAYTDFLNKLMKVINEIAPSKEIRIKNNNQDWFDREVADLIHVRKKFFLNFISMRKFTKKLETKLKN